MKKHADTDDVPARTVEAVAAELAAADAVHDATCAELQKTANARAVLIRELNDLRAQL